LLRGDENRRGWTVYQKPEKLTVVKGVCACCTLWYAGV